MATKKTAAKKSTTSKKASTATETSTVDSVVDEVTERAEDAFETVVRYAREAAHTSIGAAFVVPERINQRKFELIDYRTFLDEAKAQGEERAADVQHFFEPFVQRVNDAVEPITEKIEAQLPAPVREAIVDGRERVRELLSA